MCGACYPAGATAPLNQHDRVGWPGQRRSGITSDDSIVDAKPPFRVMHMCLNGRVPMTSDARFART